MKPLYFEILFAGLPKPSTFIVTARPGGRATRSLSTIMPSVNWWMTKSFCGRSCLPTRFETYVRDLVDLLGGHRADRLAGDLAVADVPLGVQREADVGLEQPALQALRLAEEVAAAGLDVEQQQRLGLARREQVALDRRVGLVGAVHPVVAGVGVGDRRDELEGGQHRLARGRVGARDALEALGGALGRADAEHAEALALRRAVERDDALARGRSCGRRPAAARRAAWGPSAPRSPLSVPPHERSASTRSSRSAASTPPAARRRRR